MNQELFDLATEALTAAKTNGAGDARVSVWRERTVEIRYRDRKPETIKEAGSRGLSIEVYVAGRYSGQRTSDLRPAALREFIGRVVASTRLLSEDPFRSLPDPKYYEGRPTLDLGLVDPEYARISPDDRHRAAQATEEACLTRGGPKVISATAGVSDERSEMVTLASNGFEGYREATSCSVGAELTVQDEGDRKPNGWDYASAVAHASLPSPETIGVGAAERTLALLGARKIKTETLPVIIENRVAGRPLGGLVEAMSGRNLQQKQSFLADRRGQKIGSDKLTLIDDPLIVGGLGSQWWDGDGISARRRVMIEAGVFNEFFIDWYYGRKLGMEPTTGGTSNLVIQPGARTIAEIMRDLGRGVLVNGFIGGNSNSTTGDFSVGITGTLFENGVLTQPVAEMNLAGNHLELWPKLAEIANDPWLYSGWRTPSLIFTDVVVSGV